MSNPSSSSSLLTPALWFLLLIVSVSAQSANVYECTESSPCESITCPPNAPCIVSCTDPSTCQRLKMTCPVTQHDCNITCLGISSCQSLALTCGGGPCHLECIGDSSCQYTLQTCNGTAENATASSSYPICTSNCVGSMTSMKAIENVGAPPHSCHTTCPIVIPSKDITSTCDNVKQWVRSNPQLPPPPNTRVNCTELSACQISTTATICPMDTPHCEISCWGQSSCQLSEVFCPVSTSDSNTSCVLDCTGAASCETTKLHCNQATYPHRCQATCANGDCSISYFIPLNCTDAYPSDTLIMYSHTPLNPSQWILNSACTISTSYSIKLDQGNAYGLFVNPLNGMLYGAPHFISSYVPGTKQNVSYTASIIPMVQQTPPVNGEYIIIHVTLIPHPTIRSLRFGLCDTCLNIELVNSTSLIFPTSFPTPMNCTALLNASTIALLGGIDGMTCIRNEPLQITIYMNPSHVDTLLLGERVSGAVQQYQQYLTVNSGILMSNPSSVMVWQGIVDPPQSTLIDNISVIFVGTTFDSLTSPNMTVLSIPSPIPSLCYGYHGPLVWNVKSLTAGFLRPPILTRYSYIVNGTTTHGFLSALHDHNIGVAQATDFISPGNISITALGTSSLQTNINVYPLDIHLVQPNKVPSSEITQISSSTWNIEMINLPTNCDLSNDTLQAIYYNITSCDIQWVWSINPVTSDGLNSLSDYVTNSSIMSSSITIPSMLLTNLPTNFDTFILTAQIKATSSAIWCRQHPLVAHSKSTTRIPPIPVTPLPPPGSSSSLSTGSLIGIIIGSVIGFILIVLLIWYMWRQCHQPTQTVSIQLTDIVETKSEKTAAITTTCSKDEEANTSQQETTISP